MISGQPAQPRRRPIAVFFQLLIPAMTDTYPVALAPCATSSRQRIFYPRVDADDSDQLETACPHLAPPRRLPCCPPRGGVCGGPPAPGPKGGKGAPGLHVASCYNAGHGAIPRAKPRLADIRRATRMDNPEVRLLPIIPRTRHDPFVVLPQHHRRPGALRRARVNLYLLQSDLLTPPPPPCRESTTPNSFSSRPICAPTVTMALASDAAKPRVYERHRSVSCGNGSEDHSVSSTTRWVAADHFREVRRQSHRWQRPPCL